MSTDKIVISLIKNVNVDDVLSKLAELKCGSKVNFIYNINRQDTPRIILYEYLNQQNTETEHECHCTGAN